MIVLAIETSCDDTSVALVDDKKHVLAMQTVSRLKEHAKFGGVVPEIAARHHEASILCAAESALNLSGIKKSEISAVAVADRPGLKGSLLVGTSFAKGISLAGNLPIICVDHIEAHAVSCIIENNNLNPPFLSLVISGGHTSVIEVKNYKNFKVYFKTIDDAAGEVLDKVARNMGIAYPGGAVLDKMAKFGDKNKFKMPIPKINNFSFSGIKTWAINIAKKINSEDEKKDLAASLVYGISNYVSENLIRIAHEINYKKIAIGGGVACSEVLREVIAKKCQEQNFEFYKTQKKYCSDNAAMIGILGMNQFLE
ncbi:MAG: tRNA (adenosine(37)-N6)-threonylcarbamoyltransferase complex transferase subunit TsaD [Clostridia bacterium]|nr:tRNA (adenosine(37)-N6)-threonylcarbamoyltransferase complex transferase subunit TsaD [Clostridia bacterium]